jgi:pilus assembly protein Flp/PilA
MNNALLKLYVKIQNLMLREEGQDLIEYALLGAIVSVGAVTVLGSLSAKIVTVFNTIITDL